MVRKLAYQPDPDTVALIRRYLHIGFDVNLVSPRGNGGSRFLRELRDEFVEAGADVILLPEVVERQPVPSAFLAVMAQASRSGAVPEAPAAIAAHLARVFEQRPVVLIIDGEANLSPEFLSVLTLYRQRAKLQLVVLSHAAIEMGALEGTSVVVRLPPLTIDKVHAVLYYRLGYRFGGTALNRVYAKSAGLIKLAIAICEVAKVEGSLQLIDGQWAVVRDLWSDALVPVTVGYVAGLSDEETTALEMLALVGLIGIEAGAEIVGAAPLEALERRGVITVSAAGTNRWVTINPPILAEMYRHTMPVARREHLSARIEELSSLRLMAQQPHERGIEVEVIAPSFLHLLAERRHESLSAAESAWRERQDALSALQFVKARAEANVGVDQVLEIVAAGRRSPGSHDEHARLAVWEAICFGYGMGDIERADAILNDTERAVEYAGFFTAAQIRMHADLGTIPHDALKRLEPRAREPLAVQNERRCVAAFVLLVQGRPAEAEAKLAEISTWEEDPFPHRRSVLGAWIQLALGRFDRAREMATLGFREAQDNLSELSLREHGHILALLLFVRGQRAEIHQIREYVLALGGLPLFPRNGYLGVMVTAATASESAREIRETLDEIDQFGTPDGPLPGCSRGWLRARLRFLEGAPEAAADDCWDNAEQLYARGATLTAVLDGLRSVDYFFDPQRHRKLKSWLAKTDSEFVAAYFEYLTARHNADTDRMLQAVPRLVSSGRVGMAVEAYESVAAIAHQNGEMAFAADIQVRQADFLETLEPNSYDTAQQEAAGATLTSRERQVAELMVAGLTNREIQAELVLSIRTVENHIHRMMRKIGVSNRTDAVDWARAWLGYETTA